MCARSAGFSGTNDKKPQLSHRSDFTYFADPDIPQNPASEVPYGRRRFKSPPRGSFRRNYAVASGAFPSRWPFRGVRRINYSRPIDADSTFNSSRAFGFVLVCRSHMLNVAWAFSNITQIFGRATLPMLNVSMFAARVSYQGSDY